MRNPVVLQSEIPGAAMRRGKVRDVYDFGDRLLLVSTDRISAFDWVLPTGIPDKGRVLTQLSAFWFGLLDEPNHLISIDVDAMDLPAGADKAALEGRSCLVRKTDVVPIECVVRGYLSGSGWKEYRQSGTVCGIKLPAGLAESTELEEPIFTPSTKAQSGHDENISMERTVELVGRSMAEELRDRSVALFCRGAAYARQRGILIADTKFEWGLVEGRLILIGPGEASRRSTSSSCATGWRPLRGTRTARPRRCRTRSSSRRGRNTWRPSSASRESALRLSVRSPWPRGSSGPPARRAWPARQSPCLPSRPAATRASCPDSSRCRRTARRCPRRPV